MIDTTTTAALTVLRARLGVVGTVAVALALVRRQAFGQPFSDLPPARSDKEKGSRAQAGPAVLLYRTLLTRMAPAEALDVVEEVVTASAIAFLQQAVGTLSRETLATMSADARRAFVMRRLQRFPNAEFTLQAVEADVVRFRVNACRLHALVVHAGHPELAPAFCKGDATFFGEVQPDVVLERATTLAEGGPCCPFVLRLR